MRNGAPHQHILQLSRLIVSTTAGVVSHAETSVGFSAQVTAQVAEFAYAACEALAQHENVPPRDARAACLCARRVRRHLQALGEEAERVAEAKRDLVVATTQIDEILASRTLPIEALRQTIDDAIRAAVRAERAARLARVQLWQSVAAAFDAALLHDEATSRSGAESNDTVSG